MLRFECDYTEGCIPEILEAISRENHTQLQGYSEDPVCDRARAKIKAICGRDAEWVAQAAKQLGWAGYETSWESLGKRDDIDIIDITENTFKCFRGITSG